MPGTSLRCHIGVCTGICREYVLVRSGYRKGTWCGVVFREQTGAKLVTFRADSPQPRFGSFENSWETFDGLSHVFLPRSHMNDEMFNAVRCRNGMLMGQIGTHKALAAMWQREGRRI
jgi:hypothetical protein